MSDTEAGNYMTAQDVHVCLFAIESILTDVKSIPEGTILTPEQQNYLEHLKIARTNLLGLKCNFIYPLRLEERESSNVPNH